MKRKGLLLAISMLFVLGGCSNSGNAKEDAVTINVYNWGDYIDESVIDTFTEETGIRVNYELFATNEDMYVKLKNGGTSYDVAFPSDFMINRMQNEGLLSEIDTANMENFSYIGDMFKNQAYDPDNQYSVPYMWGTTGIVYNKELVKEPVDSWRILWDDKYRQQIFMYNSQRGTIGVTLKMLGYSANTTNSQELTEAKKALIQQKPLVLSYAGDDVKDKMIAGDAALAIMYSGDAMYVKEQNPDLEYVIPKEGTFNWYDGMVIPKSSKHPKEAEAFINFMCRPDIALKNTVYIGYSTPNQEALKELPEEIRNDPAYTPPEDILPKCEIIQDVGDFIKEYDKAWTEILAG